MSIHKTYEWIKNRILADNPRFTTDTEQFISSFNKKIRKMPSEIHGKLIQVDDIFTFKDLIILCILVQRRIQFDSHLIYLASSLNRLPFDTDPLVIHCNTEGLHIMSGSMQMEELPDLETSFNIFTEYINDLCYGSLLGISHRFEELLYRDDGRSDRTSSFEKYCQFTEEHVPNKKHQHTRMETGKYRNSFDIDGIIHIGNTKTSLYAILGNVIIELHRKIKKCKIMCKKECIPVTYEGKCLVYTEVFHSIKIAKVEISFTYGIDIYLLVEKSSVSDFESFYGEFYTACKQFTKERKEDLPRVVNQENQPDEFIKMTNTPSFLYNMLLKSGPGLKYNAQILLVCYGTKDNFFGSTVGECFKKLSTVLSLENINPKVDICMSFYSMNDNKVSLMPCGMFKDSPKGLITEYNPMCSDSFSNYNGRT